MADQDRAEHRSEWLSAEQMAALCGVSVATVKRRCEDGKPIRCRDGTLVPIQSERIARPQGWEWRVRAMTAPPALSERSERRSDHDDQGATAPITSADQAALTIRSLDILDTLLRANADSLDAMDERLRVWIERATRAEADAEYAQRERQTILEALRTAQAALSAAQESADTQRQRADMLQAERDRLAAELERRDRAAEGRRAWWQRMWG